MGCKVVFKNYDKVLENSSYTRVLVIKFSHHELNSLTLNYLSVISLQFCVIMSIQKIFHDF